MSFLLWNLILIFSFLIVAKLLLQKSCIDTLWLVISWVGSLLRHSLLVDLKKVWSNMTGKLLVLQTQPIVSFVPISCAHALVEVSWKGDSECANIPHLYSPQGTNPSQLINHSKSTSHSKWNSMVSSCHCNNSSTILSHYQESSYALSHIGCMLQDLLNKSKSKLTFLIIAIESIDITNKERMFTQKMN